MTSIATRTGDAGTTSLLYGQRVAKDHPQIEAVGTFDELNVALGATKPLLTDPVVQALITGLQHNLVALMGELACAESDVARYADSKFAKITEDDVKNSAGLGIRYRPRDRAPRRAPSMCSPRPRPQRAPGIAPFYQPTRRSALALGPRSGAVRFEQNMLQETAFHSALPT
jgi:Cobalamin adenosyltransferase